MVNDDSVKIEIGESPLQPAYLPLRVAQAQREFVEALARLEIKAWDAVTVGAPLSELIKARDLLRARGVSIVAPEEES